MAPSTTSSTLGCIAAVIDTVSPSQLRPVVIQIMCTSLTAGGFWVFLPYGAASVAIIALLLISAGSPYISLRHISLSQLWAAGRKLSLKRLGSRKWGGLERAAGSK